MPTMPDSAFIGITGASGGLGLRLLQHLLKNGHRVKLLLRKPSKLDASLANQVEIIQGDLEDKEALDDFCRGLSACFHLAAEINSCDRAQLFRTNVQGTKQLCKILASVSPNCHLIHCSSIAVHGIRWYNHFLYSDYALSKNAAEHVIRASEKRHQLKATIVRSGYIYGPGDMKFLPAIESMLSKGLPYLIKGGEKFAPLVFIDDLCELMIRASGNRKAVGKCYTAIPREEAGIHDVLQRIAETRGYSFPQHKKNKLPLVIQAMLWGLLYRAMGKKERPPINLRLINLLSIRGKAFDLDARKDLDWNTGHSLDEGLQLALAWNADAHT